MMKAMVTDQPLTDIPDTAAPDFLGGILSAQWAVDIHVELRACMTPSDDLDFIIDNAMRGLQAGNTDYFVAQVERSLPYYDTALQSCQDNTTVTDMLNQLDDFWGTWTSQDNWEELAWANYATYQHYVDGYADQMIDSWFLELYFGSGQLFGLGSAFIFMPAGFEESMSKETAQSIALLNRQILQSLH